MSRLSRYFAVLLLLSFSAVAMGADGLVTVKSPYSAAQTVKRLEQVVKKKGLKLFARINHAAGAAKIGVKLRPTEVLIFGNPKGGTPLLQCAQTTGIDLPLKALVWQDEAGQVWLGYNDPAWIAARHQATGCDAVVQNLSKALAGIAQAVTRK